MIFIVAFLVALVVSYCANRFVVIPILRRHAVIDHPNARSSHSVPVVRGGGIGLATGYTVGAGVGIGIQITQSDGSGLGLFVGLAAIGAAIVCGAVGLADDLDSFSALVRLSLQVVLGLLFGTLILLWSPWGWTAVLAIAASVVLVVNATNFMDGVNTLITGWAIIVGLWYFVVALVSEQTQLAIVAASICGAAVAFVPLNRTPAQAFLGDVGSYAIGGIAIALFWLLWVGGASRLEIVAPLVIPLFDVLVTLIKRLYSRENIFQPHKKHYYQRLNQAGLSHEHVSLVFAVAVIACCGVSLLGNRMVALISWVAIAVIYAALPHFVSQRKSAKT